MSQQFEITTGLSTDNLRAIALIADSETDAPLYEHLSTREAIVTKAKAVALAAEEKANGGRGVAFGPIATLLPRLPLTIPKYDSSSRPLA